MLSSSSLQPNNSLVAASLTFCHYVKHLPLTLTAEANVYVTTCLAVSVVHFCADYNDDEQRRVRGGHTTAVTNVKAPHLALALALRCTLGQNHKKHSIALLVPFVSKKGTNRGIKCQFDILEKNPKGGPFYVKNFFISDFTQVSCANFLGHKDSKHEI